MKRILFIVMLPVALHASWNDNQAFESAMAQAVSNKEELMSTTFTNQLARFIQSSTNVNDQATATLILAISMAVSFEQTLDQALYFGSRNLATNITGFATLPENSWQRSHSDLLLAGSYAMDNKYLPAYNILTNSLRVINQPGYTDPTNTVLTAINNYIYEMPDLTIQQILSLYAGFSIAELGNPVAARALVAHLPLKYRQMVEEIISGNP